MLIMKKKRQNANFPIKKKTKSINMLAKNITIFKNLYKFYNFMWKCNILLLFKKLCFFRQTWKIFFQWLDEKSKLSLCLKIYLENIFFVV